ncbi:MAG: CoA-binding protein [Planctomycetota bacterium]
MESESTKLVKQFLLQGPYAVVGASTDPSKFGNKILRCYLQHKKKVYPIHPKEKTIEGVSAYPRLSALPEKVERVSVVTPPAITEQIVEEAGNCGVKYIWMQPGAESPKAIQRAKELGMEVIAEGPCLLVALGFRE